MLTVTGKNPFLIGFADGIFAFKPVFYYGQRSKCADLLNSYQIPSKKDPPESISAFRGSFFFYKLLPNQIITCAGHLAAHLPQPVHFV